MTILAESPLFAGVPANVVEIALHGSELLTFARGETVLAEGASAHEGEATALYVLLEGQLAATRLVAGNRTQRLSTIQPGDFFGELARVEEGTRSATVSAVTRATVVRIPGPVADRLLADAPVVMRTIAAAIAHRLRAADEARILARVNEERLSLIGKAAAMLVHDLKDPLGRVLNAADCIDNGIGVPSIWTAQSRRAAHFMLAIVKDLTDYARGEQTFARAPVPLADIIEDVEAFGLRPLEAAGKVHVERRIAAAATFMGDQRALSRALLNLVKNAAEELSSSGGTLTFEAGPAEGHVIRFVVADNGRGIPDEVLPTIFEPFATYGKKNGTGLGMAMTKAAIDAHNGDIEVVSGRGAGTRFTITIPA
jgi:signal transduction histidine kinase